MAAVELYLRSRDTLRLAANPDDPRKLPAFIGRGPIDTEAINSTYDDMLWLTASPGPGLMIDWQFDGHIVNVRSVGLQDDPDSAEATAFLADELMLSPGNVLVGSLPALYVTRAGGPPTPIMRDTSRRTHYGCAYVIPVKSGL